jgi:hypothetical protein
MRHDDFEIFMTSEHGDDWCGTAMPTKDKIFATVLDVWRDLNAETASENAESELGSLKILSEMDGKNRLAYRGYLAEAGVEFTPKQVDFLCDAIRYAFDAFEDEMDQRQEDEL